MGLIFALWSPLFSIYNIVPFKFLYYLMAPFFVFIVALMQNLFKIANYFPYIMALDALSNLKRLRKIYMHTSYNLQFYFL